jgi:hypothetical protein
MYVINVHGLAINDLKEEGTEKRLRVYDEISGLSSRKPIMETIVISRNIAIFIYISLVRLLPLLKVPLILSQIPINREF